MNTGYEYQFSVAVGLFCFVCAILVSLVLFVVKCSIFSRVNSVSKFMVGYAILASIFYLLGSLFAGLFWLCAAHVINDILLYNLFNFIQILFWHLGQAKVYCYLLTRLYKGFEGTVYSIKRNTSIIFVILLCCYLFACGILFVQIIHYILWYLKNPNTDVRDLPYFKLFVNSYKSITLGVDLILSTTLLLIFINKLRKINESLNVMINNQCHSGSINDSLIVNDKNNLKLQSDNIYTVVSKVFILGVIMIVASQIVLILSLLNWNLKRHYILNFVYAWIRGFHTLIASLSVFLGFEFAHNWYTCICGRCHRCIKWCITTKNPDVQESVQFDFSSKSQR